MDEATRTRGRHQREDDEEAKRNKGRDKAKNNQEEKRETEKFVLQAVIVTWVSVSAIKSIREPSHSV